VPKTPVSAWVMASRPKTLWAAISPVLIGISMAYADRGGYWPAALAALFGAVMIQIGTNFANDYWDFKKGSDTVHRIGPTRVTQAGLITPSAMVVATIAAFGLAFLAGIYLVYRGGWPIVAIGLSSILFGVLYTAGPAPLGYTGLGDLFVLIYFGPVAVAGTYYVQALTVTPEVVISGLAPGLFSVGILTVNNLRDIDSDHQAGKKTLPVRFGRGFARAEYLISIVLACLVPILLVIMTGRHYFSMGAFVTIMVSQPVIVKVFTSTDGTVLNDALADTGKLLLLYSVLFGVGWLL